MAGYFKDIWQGITTVIAGMEVTFKHLFEPAITIQYPREIKEMYPRARAMLVNTIDDCECCYKCQRICPIDIFVIKGIRAGKDEDLGMLPTGKPKLMYILEFDIDFSKCLYCGLCVDVCETESLHWESPQEASTFCRQELYKSFADMPEEKKQELLEKEAAKKAARAEAAAAKAAAKPAPKPVPRREDKAGEEGE
ncbi:4Fe-4S binding protein [bacterium]|nr:4Fe-4S binding protein [bacterium]